MSRPIRSRRWGSHARRSIMSRPTRRSSRRAAQERPRKTEALGRGSRLSGRDVSQTSMWPFSKRRKPPQQMRQSAVEFIGEQDGPPERELKSELGRIFASRREVARAFLVRVRYPGTSDVVVALAISAPEDPGLADQVGQVFWRMFSRGACLDITFLKPDAEAQVARVCMPFYTAG